ncbi:unnamed protein product [Pieris macdunnoughi]|uniref:Uncharacterized protein n=1 Tax=Pieris macdunnoughi TaxID=345717 RepID=A0A821LNN6_9NEOP|nr:unnamed protein product [Pieris macdunnoughi]
MLIILLCLPCILSAPLHMLMPMQYPIAPMQPMPDMQLMEMQRLRINPFLMNQPQPLVVLLPNDPPNEFKTKADYGKEDEELNSVVIDAPETQPPRALVLLPNGRFSIGDFISAIPWLPIEVNVPDSISWAYNGIANGIGSIISIIGQRLPFQRPSDSMIVNNQLKQNAANPVMFLPYNTQVMHLPIKV